MNNSDFALRMTTASRVWGVLGIFCLGTSAFAQSAGALATSPYVPLAPAPKPATQSCVCADAKPAPSVEVAAKPQTATLAGQALPIVMFRGTPAAPLPKPAFVSMVPVQIASAPEAPQPAASAVLPPTPIAQPAQRVAAPPTQQLAPLQTAKREKPAGPFKRIWRDTKRSVVEDIPEALADALPWVDRGEKDEPIEQVLARVSSDLSRASAQDPEWINPAESELRELSKRLATLAEPPAGPELESALVTVPEGDSANRPFRPRPIWPGASGRPEMQSRPTALVTGSTIQQGPEAVGQRLAPPTDWVEEEEKAPKPPPQQVVAKRAKRPTK